MKRSILVFVIIGMFVVSLGVLMPAQPSLAQRDTPTPATTDTPAPRDTPTPISTNTPVPSGGGGGDAGSSKPAPTPQNGNVWGYVVDYSNGAAPQAGIAVVLDGGGWQAEAVTDSNGYYAFAGLGAGWAKMSLRLPPGTHQVMPDWPVYTGAESSGQTDLGYYWGDVPPLPVLLSADMGGPDDGLTLTFSVKNRSGGMASNAMLAVNLPDGATAAGVKVSQGSVADADGQIQGRFGDIAAGQTATLVMMLQTVSTAEGETPVAAAMLNYDEQITAQRLAVNLSLTASESPATAPAAAQTETTTATQVTTDTESLIPTTGGQQNAPPASNRIVIALSLLFIVGLGAAGIRAFGQRA